MAKTPSRPKTAPKGDPDTTIREIARVMRSLADENRLRILFMLAEHGEMHVSAIGEELGQSQPAVSHHLAQLKNAGLVETRRDGKFNFYAPSSTGLATVVAELFPAGTPAKITLGGVEISFKRK